MTTSQIYGIINLSKRVKDKGPSYTMDFLIGVKMNQLTKEQIAVVNTTASRVLVEASPATGKTHTLVARLQHLIDSGENQRRIVAITFTNNAAAEMRSRLKGVTDMFIGTVHSYCNFLLTVSGISTNDLIESEDFDKLFQRIKLHPDCVMPIDHLLVDEAQDSTRPQFEFFLSTLQPKNYMMFYDLRQSIYGFAHAKPEILIDLRHQPNVTRYTLSLNYRNGEEILNFAKDLIRPLGQEFIDYSMSMTPWCGEVYQRHLTPTQIIEDIIMEAGEEHYGEWMWLCRTNSDVDDFMNRLARHKIPATTFKQGELSLAELKEQVGMNCVKVLTMHSAKGLESERVIVWNPHPWISDEERRLCFVAATRARKQLWWISQSKVKKKKAREKVFKWE